MTNLLTIRPTVPAPLRAGRLLAVTATAWAALAAVLFVWSGRFSLAAVERACGAPAPDVRTAPSPSEVQAFVAACGPDGLAAYRDLQVVDLLYPTVNATLLVLVLALLVSRLTPSLRWLLLLPVVAAAGDYVENVAAWVMLGQGPESTSWVDALFPVGSAVKVGATWAAWLAVTALLVWLMVLWARRRLGRASGQPASRSWPPRTPLADSPGGSRREPMAALGHASAGRPDLHTR